MADSSREGRAINKVASASSGEHKQVAQTQTSLKVTKI